MPDLMHNAPIRSDLLDGTLNGYQKAALTTAIYPGRGTFLGLMYVTIKGGGEVGEFQEKVGKLLRDDYWHPSDLLSNMPPSVKERLLLELGDELWYLAAKAEELGYTLQQVAEANIGKLSSRQQRGTLSGSGDNR